MPVKSRHGIEGHGAKQVNVEEIITENNNRRSYCTGNMENFNGISRNDLDL
jgi:hypothetical protein